jgi:uncharacterized membrane protein
LLAVSIAGAAGASFWGFASEPHFIAVTGAGSIDVSISGLKQGHVELFSYRDHAGDEIRFLLARDSNGRVHAAFDACERCYTYHRGYAASHGELICRFCGNHYKLEAMDSGLASCVPVKLRAQIAGQTAKIRSAELERGRQLF